MLIRGRLRKETVPKEQWEKVAKCKAPSEVRKLLAEHHPQLHLADLFRLDAEPGSISWLQRIPEGDHGAVDGDKAARHHLCAHRGKPSRSIRSYGTRECQKVEDVYKKFGGLPGFVGAIATQNGCGARFREHQYAAARGEAGLPTGTVFTVDGIPVEFDEDAIPQLLAAMNWHIKVIPYSRRVRGQVAQIKVRAQQPPERMVARLKTPA